MSTNNAELTDFESRLYDEIYLCASNDGHAYRASGTPATRASIAVSAAWHDYKMFNGASAETRRLFASIRGRLVKALADRWDPNNPAEV